MAASCPGLIMIPPDQLVAMVTMPECTNDYSGHGLQFLPATVALPERPGIGSWSGRDTHTFEMKIQLTTLHFKYTLAAKPSACTCSLKYLNYKLREIHIHDEPRKAFFLCLTQLCS
jgi:hypothetical protein